MTSGLDHNRMIIKTQPIFEKDIQKVQQYMHANIPRPTPDGQRINFFQQQSTSIMACQLMNVFFLQPPRSAYKTFLLVRS